MSSRVQKAEDPTVRVEIIGGAFCGQEAVSTRSAMMHALEVRRVMTIHEIKNGYAIVSTAPGREGYMSRYDGGRWVLRYWMGKGL